MPRIVPYVCPVPGLPAADQRRSAARHAAAWVANWGPGWSVAPVVEDDEEAAQRQLLCRPGGMYLTTRGEPGDVLLFATVFSVSRLLRDVAGDLRGFLAMRMHVALVDVVPWPLSESEVELLYGLAFMEQAVARQQAAEAMELKRRRGKLLTGSVPPGFRLVGRKGHRRVVEDPREQQVIWEIVEWRRQGLSLDAIHLRLLERRVKTRAGRDWSRTRIDEASKHLLATQA